MLRICLISVVQQGAYWYQQREREREREREKGKSQNRYNLQ